MLLTACGVGGNDALLSDVKLDSPVLALDGQGGPKMVNLNYHIGQQASVSLSLSGADGTNYLLRQDESRPQGDYSLPISGLVDFQQEGLPQRRLLADGVYRYSLTGSAGGKQVREEGELRVSGNKSEGLPEVSGLSAFPAVISPNFDAVDDTTILNWRTSRPATVTVAVSGPDGFNKLLKTAKNQPPQEDKVPFNGLDLQNKPLADGVYSFTVTATDVYGQISQRANTIEVKGGGIPQVRATFIDISPTQITTGNEVTVRVRVKNTGKVPVRSQGPNPVYTYSTRDVYSSIDNGKYDEQAGYWRIGVDFEANSTSGAVRYPWRWGFGKEYLQPGEEVEITGKIRIDRPEQSITLYVGLIQEKISLQDRLRITTIKLSY